MAQDRWSGSLVRKWRKHFTPMVVAGDCICPKCQLPILPDQRWQVGHQHARGLGGGHEASNLAPEHGRCNESDGTRVRMARRGPRPAPPVVTTRRSWGAG